MNLAGVLGLAFVLFTFGLILTFTAASRRERPGRILREIPAFTRLRRSVGLAVETGTRLHLSLGRGSVTGPQSTVALVGLSMLERISRSTAVSDRPPVSTAGEGALTILSQDTLRSSARNTGTTFDPVAGRLTGLTPFSYAAGILPLIHDEQVGASLLVGSMGSEAALIGEASDRAEPDSRADWLKRSPASGTGTWLS